MTQIAMRASPTAARHRRTVTFRLCGPSTVLFASSWFIVTTLGLMLIAEAMLHRTPSVPWLAVVAFILAVGSAAALRRRYVWLGILLHSYSQIDIWLSITICSVALIVSAIVG